MSAGLIIQTVAILVSVSCSLLGVLLVLKNTSMLTDAITHTVLLGIVLAFLIVTDLTSPLLLIGAVLIGLLTVYLVELMTNTRLIKEDAAIGVVLSFLFSIAVILISRKLANVHLDIDTVLLGEIAFAPFHTVNIFGVTIVSGIFKGILMLLANLIFILIFFKEIKIGIFDKALASSLGMFPIFIHYGLMTLVSATSVLSFEAVGSVLLIAFMIGPPVTAFLISKKLKQMMLISIVIGIVSSIIGYHIAILIDISIAGSIAVVIGVIFLVVFAITNLSKKIKVDKTNEIEKAE